MQTPANHAKPWTEHDTQELVNLFECGLSLKPIALAMQRTEAAIASRLVYMGYLVNRGGIYHKVDPNPWGSTLSQKSIDLRSGKYSV